VTALWEAHASAQKLTLSLLSTMAVFFLAHVWSAIAGERVQEAQGFGVNRAIAIAREEWPMLEAGIAPICALALAWAGVLDRDDGARLAIALGVVQLFAWGYVVGRRAYHRLGPALASAAIDGVLGLVIVGLEVLVLH
jgi:hypothetical protein